MRGVILAASSVRLVLFNPDPGVVSFGMDMCIVWKKGLCFITCGMRSGRAPLQRANASVFSNGEVTAADVRPTASKAEKLEMDMAAIMAKVMS